MKTFRKLTALLLAALAVALLAGCGGAAVEETGGGDMLSGGTDATGRYLERQVELPWDGYAVDMAVLSDGRVRLAIQNDDGSIVICTTTPDRSTWDQVEPLAVEGSVDSVALASSGDIFCCAMEGGEGAYTPRLWYFPADGEVREIPVTYPEVDPETGYFIIDSDFTASGQLYVSIYISDVFTMDTQTGALSANLNESGTSIMRLSCAGEEAYTMAPFGGVAGVISGGAYSEIPGVLGEQIEQTLLATEGNTPHLTLWQNDDGYIFFTTHDGLCSYIPGGSVTEELVSGSRSTLGDPAFFPEALAGTEDGDFYVFGSYDGAAALFAYTFDAEAPINTETQLRIYSLYTDADLSQMISRYQVTNPDVTITLEIGVTGSDGVTEADAIRTLNTQILAGEGPDLLRLDGFSIQSLAEKGLLADLTEVLAQAEPTLEQVTRCYAQDGTVPAVPTSFALPAIYGPTHLTGQIRDLDGLVSAVTLAAAEKPQTRSVALAFFPAYLADKFYDACSAAWVNGEELDQGALEQFYAAMAALYPLDAQVRQEYPDDFMEMAQEYVVGDYTGIAGGWYILSDNACVVPGTMSGMYSLAFALTGQDRLEGYSLSYLELQGGNTFVPQGIMAILTTSARQEAAGDFLTFMLSRQVQEEVLDNGFPVNQGAFDAAIQGGEDYDSYIEAGQVLYPSEADRQALKTQVDALTTPASTDRILRQMVMDQMDACCNGETSPAMAAEQAARNIRLYLSE